MQVDLASAFSAGLLAGAALGVILPEGFESFSRAQAEGQSQARFKHIMRLCRRSHAQSRASLSPVNEQREGSHRSARAGFAVCLGCTAHAQLSLTSNSMIIGLCAVSCGSNLHALHMQAVDCTEPIPGGRKSCKHELSMVVASNLTALVVMCRHSWADT